MSMLKLRIDKDCYGCAALLATSLPPSLIREWIASIEQPIAFIRRFIIRKYASNNTNNRKWYVIQFDVMGTKRDSVKSVDEIYDLFFKNTVLHRWLSSEHREHKRDLRRLGSAEDIDCKATDWELSAIAEVIGGELRKFDLRDKCVADFKRRKDGVSWNLMQELVDKYGYVGGRWLLRSSYSKSREERIAKRIWIWDKLVAAFLEGPMADVDFIDKLTCNGWPTPRGISSTFAVCNTISNFTPRNGHSYPGCFHDDAQVEYTFKLLCRIGMFNTKRIFLRIQYKPAICSLCDVMRKKPEETFIPQIYIVRLDGRGLKCPNCNYVHETWAHKRLAYAVARVLYGE